MFNTHRFHKSTFLNSSVQFSSWNLFLVQLCKKWDFIIEKQLLSCWIIKYTKFPSIQLLLIQGSQPIMIMWMNFQPMAGEILIKGIVSLLYNLLLYKFCNKKTNNYFSVLDLLHLLIKSNYYIITLYIIEIVFFLYTTLETLCCGKKCNFFCGNLITTLP